MANRRFIDFPIATTVGDNDIILIWQSGMNKQTTKATLLNGLPENLEDLLDVNITGLTNGQILRYDSVTGKWENTDQGNLDLDDLNDVTIVSPTNGQVLVYNSSTSKWENSSAGFVPYTGAISTVNLGAQTIQAGSFVKAGGTSSQFLKADGSVDSTAYGTGSVTSVGLTMPSAFNVANSPVTTSGTLAVTGAGTVGQYIRGDGSLADFPASTGGGSSVSYYLNGSVSQGTIGGVAYKELNKVPILGTGTDFTINADGYIAQFLTDAGDPNLLEIPGGNWNFETYFSASSGGGSPTFYVELYKYDGSTFTLIASNSGNPELIAFGTNVTSYFSTLAVPTTALTLTDRLAIRYYVTHSGRTITLHTENNHLCQVITTFTTGLTALNGLTAQVQYFAVGTSGTDFNISSATQTHTFNLPTASASNRGALSSSDWTTFNNKQNALTNPVTGTGTTNYLPKFTGTSSIGNSIVQDAGIRVDIGGDIRLTPSSSVNIQAYTGSVYTNLFYNAASHNWQNSGGATKMFLNSNDNLLIGTTTDGGQKLQVTGTFALRASASISSATQIPIFNADPSGTTRELVTRTPAQLLSDIGGQAALTNPVTGTGTTNYLPKFTGSTTVGNSQVFDNGSGVGIGGTNTDSLLTINGTAGTTHERFREGSTTIGFIGGANGLITGQNGKLAVRAEAGLVLSSQGNSPDVLITSGNLLVGTTTDNGARLQVSGAVSTSSKYAWGTAINGTTGQIATDNTHNYFDYLGNLYFRGAAASNTLITFTNTGAATFSSSVTAASIASNNGGFRLKESSQTSSRNWIIGNDWLVYGDLGIGQSTTQTGATYTYPIYINPSGNVGIGTSSPTHKLQILGGPDSGIRLTDSSGNTRALLNPSGAQHGEFSLYNSSGNITTYLGGPGSGVNYVMAQGGNFLIGTTTDNGGRLQVSGAGVGNTTARFGDGLVRFGVTDNGSNQIISIAPGVFGIDAPGIGNGRFIVNSSGNVGIGTSSPDIFGFGTAGKYLTIQSNAGGFSLIQVISDGTSGSGINFGNATIRRASIDALNGSDLAFFTNGTNSGTGITERMRITSSGNLIINPAGGYNQSLLTVKGATTDGKQIHIVQSNDDRGWRFSARTDGHFYLASTYNGSDSNVLNARYDTGNVLIGTTTDYGQRLQVAGGASTALRLDANSGVPALNIGAGATISVDAPGVGGGRFLLNSSGNVGIGTSSPSNILHLFKSTYPILTIQSTSYQSSLGIDTASGLLVLNNESNAALGFNTNATERMRITAGGEVLIGNTDNGAYNLQCNGTGVWGAGAYVNGSDRNIKDNIATIEKGLEYIQKMNPVKFRYKPNYTRDHSMQTGFIAQELQEVFASEDYLSGLVQQGVHLSVAYQNLLPVLVKAIQEQQEIINDLKQKIQ